MAGHRGGENPGSESQVGHHLDNAGRGASSPEPRFSQSSLGLVPCTSWGCREDQEKGGSVFKPRGPAGAWGWDDPHGLGCFPQLSFQGGFAYASSMAHRIVATVLGGVNLSPQARTPRKSHCHRDPPPLPGTWGRAPHCGKRSWREEGTVNREDCGFSTISSIKNNKLIQKGKCFRLQENVLPRERQSQPIPTQLIPGGGNQVKDKPPVNQWKRANKTKQNWQAGRVSPEAWPTEHLAHGRHSQNT